MIQRPKSCPSCSIAVSSMSEELSMTMTMTHLAARQPQQEQPQQHDDGDREEDEVTMLTTTTRPSMRLQHGKEPILKKKQKEDNNDNEQQEQQQQRFEEPAIAASSTTVKKRVVESRQHNTSSAIFIAGMMEQILHEEEGESTDNKSTSYSSSTSPFPATTPATTNEYHRRSIEEYVMDQIVNHHVVIFTRKNCIDCESTTSLLDTFRKVFFINNSNNHEGIDLDIFVEDLDSLVQNVKQHTADMVAEQGSESQTLEQHKTGSTLPPPMMPPTPPPLTRETIRKELTVITKQPTMPLVWINGIFIGGKNQTRRAIKSGHIHHFLFPQQQEGNGDDDTDADADDDTTDDDYADDIDARFYRKIHQHQQGKYEANSSFLSSSSSFSDHGNNMHDHCYRSTFVG